MNEIKTHVWSGVHHDSIIDAIHHTPSGIRCVRDCKCVVAPDEVEDVEFLSRNDVDEVNEEVKKKKLA